MAQASRYSLPAIHVPHLVSTIPQAFAYGRFLGDYRAQRDVGTLALAELLPTVPGACRRAAAAWACAAAT